jgi:hypothetical protein
MIVTTVVVTGALLVTFVSRRRTSRDLLAIGDAFAAVTAPLVRAIAPTSAQAVLGALGVAPPRLEPLDLEKVAWLSDEVEPQVGACFAGWSRPVPVNVVLTLTPAGRVEYVSLHEPAEAPGSVRDCVARAYRSMTPAPFQGEVATFAKAFLVR